MAKGELTSMYNSEDPKMSEDKAMDLSDLTDPLPVAKSITLDAGPVKDSTSLDGTPCLINAPFDHIFYQHLSPEYIRFRTLASQWTQTMMVQGWTMEQTAHHCKKRDTPKPHSIQLWL